MGQPLISSLNEAYEKSGDFKYLTNSLGEQCDDEIVPEAPYEWYENLGIDTSSLLYLVRIKGQCGLLIINEYDACYMDDAYDNDIEKMRRAIRYSAQLIKNEKPVDQYDVYVGEYCGFKECDEIAVFIPYSLNIDTNTVREAINRIDRLVYLTPATTTDITFREDSE